MSATGLAVFDSTLQATNVWLDDVMDELRWTDRHKAYQALRTVLHALRDRLQVNAAAHLSAQLPMLIRGIYFEGWQPSKVPVKERTADQFLVHITEAFLFDTESDPQAITHAVLRVLAKHVSPGELDNLQASLPSGIRQLWTN